jgi:hypothetical protein
MPTYLVEVYLPRSRAHEARATARRARAAAEQLSREGVPIRYVRTTYLPDDETCFHHFEARTPAAVEEATRRAALGSVRIVPTIEVADPCVGTKIEANRRSGTSAKGGPACRTDWRSPPVSATRHAGLKPAEDRRWWRYSTRWQ